MAVYTPDQLGIKPPSGGFQQGGWYAGRQFWGGTLSDPGVIHPSSNQQGAGQAVSAEVNAQSAAEQGVTPQQLESYLQEQRNKTQTATPYTPTSSKGVSLPSTGAGGSGGASLLSSNQTINLPELYKSLTKESGIEEKQNELSEKEKAYNEAVSVINDNPWLSEATRVGRIQKLSIDFQNATAGLRKDIETKKADVEMQLNLQTKQFDINSQTARDALNQFNTLLDLGAFDNATGDDIAAITRTTGLSSTMIQNAINARVDKNVQTEVIKYDDGTNQGFVVINSKTGDIISRNVVAASETKTTGGLTTTQSRGVTADARSIIQTVDEQYRTIGSKLKKLEFEEEFSGDQRLSAQEYLKAVQMLMASAGISEEQAGQYISQAMDDMEYKNWSPK